MCIRMICFNFGLWMVIETVQKGDQCPVWSVVTAIRHICHITVITFMWQINCSSIQGNPCGRKIIFSYFLFGTGFCQSFHYFSQLFFPSFLFFYNFSKFKSKKLNSRHLIISPSLRFGQILFIWFWPMKEIWNEIRQTFSVIGPYWWRVWSEENCKDFIKFQFTLFPKAI